MKVRSTTGSRDQRVKNSLDVARDSFALLVTGWRPLSLNGSRFPGMPAQPLPLDEVRDLLLTRQCGQETSDAVWAHLVRQSRSEGREWTVAAIGVALPALTSVAAMLSRWCPGDPADLHAEVLRGFLDAVATVDVTRPWIMLRLRWAAFRAGYAVATEALAEQARCTVVRSQPQSPPWGHPDIVLAQAIADGVLTPTEADLIGTTRLESVSVSQWAADREVGDWAAYKARRRAEHRLVGYLQAAMTDTDHTDLVAAQATTGAALSRRRGTRNEKPSADNHNPLSKRDQDSGLQCGGEFPRTSTSPEVRPCA